MPERCPNFIIDTINLIYYSDQEKFRVVHFLKDIIEKYLNNNILNNLYLTLLTKYDLSDIAIETITDFFTQNNWNINVNKLLDLIKISPNIKKIMLKKISKYVIREDEFFELEETNNYKLLSELLKSENIFQNENKESNPYIEKTIKVISSIKEKIKLLDINYNLIAYFIDNNKEEILYNRLLIIFLLKEEDAKNQKNLLIKNVTIIKLALNTIQSYLDKVSLFFPNKYYKEIIDLNSLVKKIKLGTIKSYLKDYSYEYNNFTTKLREDIEKIGKRAESSFFISIYNDVKIKNILDDEKCFKLAIKNFEKVKDILSKNKLEDSNENIVQMILRPFKNKEIELKKEIDIDIEILRLQKVKDKFKLYEDLLLLSKREDILNILESIKVFINEMGVKKTDFNKDIGSAARLAKR